MNFTFNLVLQQMNKFKWRWKNISIFFPILKQTTFSTAEGIKNKKKKLILKVHEK